LDKHNIDLSFLKLLRKVNLDNQAEVTNLLNTILNEYGSSVHNLDPDLKEWFDKTLDFKRSTMRLSPYAKEAIFQHYVKGYEYQEIAYRYGISMERCIDVI